MKEIEHSNLDLNFQSLKGDGCRSTKRLKEVPNHKRTKIQIHLNNNQEIHQNTNTEQIQ